MVEPRERAEVDGLADVEAGGEASVVTAGEGDDELAWLLDEAVDGDSVLAEVGGRHHRRHVVNEVGFVLLERLQLALQKFLQLVGEGFGFALVVGIVIAFVILSEGLR